VFSFFPGEKQVELVSGIGRERMSKLLEAMPHDDRADLLKRLSPEVVENLLPLVAKADREDIRKLLSYPEHSAGAVMTTDYASLPADITAAEAIVRLRQQAPAKETIYYIYVLDAERHLIGSLSLRDLIVASPGVLLSDLMQRDIISVRLDENDEQVARTMARYDFLAIPVVDDQNRLVGIITHDDIMDVVVQEATEDVLHMGGVGTMTENYLQAPIVTVWRSRAVWLSCLFVAELATFNALAHFDDAIKQIRVLALLVPLCISTGGNSGSQAATLITRAMALGHVGLRDWLRVLRHELLMGVMLGLTLGIIAFLRGSLTPLMDPEVLLDAAGQPEVQWFMLALVLAQAVAMICLWGTLVGSMLPFIFKRLGFDPAFASSPFVATFVDVTGIVIFFNIAWVYLLRSA
jgi:magnesium transporter